MGGGGRFRASSSERSGDSIFLVFYDGSTGGPRRPPNLAEKVSSRRVKDTKRDMHGNLGGHAVLALYWFKIIAYNAERTERTREKEEVKASIERQRAPFCSTPRQNMTK
jgi:hypothetical protein